MKNLSYVKKMVFSAMCITLCIVMPMMFHMIPNIGSVISPMHIPVLLCGLICGWPFGLLCGLAGPLLSYYVTGMPMPPFLQSIMVELAVYGIVTGLLTRLVRTKSRYADLYICLIPAMLIGRIIAGVVRALIISPGEFTFAMWVSGYFISALPGIVIHLVLIPVVMLALESAKLIPARYPMQHGH